MSLPGVRAAVIGQIAAGLGAAILAGLPVAGAEYATSTPAWPGPRGGPMVPSPPPSPPPPRPPASFAPPPLPVPPPAPPAALADAARSALPGVAGLVALAGLGGLIGYRQAKAGFAMRAAGTARFLP